MQYTAWPEVLLEIRAFRFFRVVLAFRFFLGVQVLEVAEEFVKAVHGRQEFVVVAEVILAELAADVTQRLEQFGDGRVLRLKAEFRA